MDEPMQRPGWVQLKAPRDPALCKWDDLYLRVERCGEPGSGMWKWSVEYRATVKPPLRPIVERETQGGLYGAIREVEAFAKQLRPNFFRG